MKEVVLLFMVFGLFSNANAQSSTLRRKHVNVTNAVAIAGYDPVAYFTQHRAIKGLHTIAYTSYGVTYYFSTVENKKTFMRNHDKYEPQYGGWCASAMSDSGSRAQVDPNNFKIIDGKLYLFCQPESRYSIQGFKTSDKSGIVKGDKNWNDQYK